MTSFYFRLPHGICEIPFTQARDFFLGSPQTEPEETVHRIEEREKAQRAAVQTKRHKKPLYQKADKPVVPSKLAAFFNNQK